MTRGSEAIDDQWVPAGAMNEIFWCGGGAPTRRGNTPINLNWSRLVRFFLIFRRRGRLYLSCFSKWLDLTRTISICRENFGRVRFSPKWAAQSASNFLVGPPEDIADRVVFHQFVGTQQQVIEKLIPMELILRDLSVSEMYIMDSMVRQSTHALLRVVISQLEQVAANPVQRGRLPSDVHVGVLGADEVLVQLDDGTLCIVRPSSRSVKRVFPVGFSVRQLLIVNHVIDRGSTGLAMVSFASHIGLLWTATWGVFHDMWNSVKNACKAVCSGRWWLMVLRFASIANLNHGPFRSGSWGKAKQTALLGYLSSRTSRSPDFRAAAFATASLLDKVCESDEDYEFWFRWASRLPSCCEAGPICKFARWMSIQECWDYYRQEMWVLRAVLLEMNPQQVQKEIQSNSTAMYDSELASRMSSGSSGLLARAPTYITQELIDVLDMFNLATTATRSLYSFRASSIKNVDQGVDFQLLLLSGAWEDELLSMVNDSLLDRAKVGVIAPMGDLERARRNAAQMAAFVLQLMTERCSRILPALFSYPQIVVRLLSPKLEDALVARASILSDWAVLRAAEADAALGGGSSAVLKDIFWKDQTLVRLLFYTIQLEAVTHPECIGPQSGHLARAISMKLPDEKGPEDIHQHIRDCQRTRRHKHIKMATVYDAQIKSGVLEGPGDRLPEGDRRCSGSRIVAQHRLQAGLQGQLLREPPGLAAGDEPDREWSQGLAVADRPRADAGLVDLAMAPTQCPAACRSEAAHSCGLVVPLSCAAPCGAPCPF